MDLQPSPENANTSTLTLGVIEHRIHDTAGKVSLTVQGHTPQRYQLRPKRSIAFKRGRICSAKSLHTLLWGDGSFLCGATIRQLT